MKLITSAGIIFPDTCLLVCHVDSMIIIAALCFVSSTKASKLSCGASASMQIRQAAWKTPLNYRSQ